MHQPQAWGQRPVPNSLAHMRRGRQLQQGTGLGRGRGRTVKASKAVMVAVTVVMFVLASAASTVLFTTTDSAASRWSTHWAAPAQA